MYKYFIYCRKSSETEDRQILSIESQERELLHFAQREELPVVQVYKEEKTAHKRGRPIFAEVLKALERRKADGLLVWQPNRLARNAFDGGWLITAMDEGYLKEIRTPFKTYSNTPDDKFFLQLEFGMAKKDSDDKSINIKRGLKAKVSEGWRPGVAPLGYLNDKAKDPGEREILVDTQRFPLVRKIFDEFLTGNYSVARIRAIANDTWRLRTKRTKRGGGKPLSLSHIYRILTEPFYYGYFYWQGELIKGKHQPMITAAEYDRIQDVLGRKGRPRPKQHHSAYTGLFRCGECNAMITVENKKQVICSRCKLKFSNMHNDTCPRCNTQVGLMSNPTLLYYTYYRCTKKGKQVCRQPFIRDQELEQKIDEELARIQLGPEFKAWALKTLQEHYREDKSQQENVADSLLRSYKDVQGRLANLLNLKLSPLNVAGSLLSDEEYAQQKVSLQKEKQRLEELLQQKGQSIEEWLSICEQVFDFAVYARCWFAEGDWETKRSILSSFGSNLSLVDKKVALNIANPLLVAIENTKKNFSEASPDFAWLEPEKSIGVTNQIRRLEERIPYLLCIWNDVRTLWMNSLDQSMWYVDDMELFKSRRHSNLQKAA
jgi:site-specific DNA recombinase